MAESSSSQPTLPLSQPPQPSQEPSTQTEPSATPPPASGSTPAQAPESTPTVKRDPDQPEGTQELDADIDRDIDMNATATDNENNSNNNNNENENGNATATDEVGGNNAAPGNAGTVPADMDALAAAAASPRKETSLREFLGKMDDYAPIVWLGHPEYVVNIADSRRLFRFLTP